MRCPKCGAFMPEGSNECLMCGADVSTLNNDNNQGSKENSIFGSGNDFRTPDRGGFNSRNYNYNNRNSNLYEQKFKPQKNVKKDIFDKYAENKSGFKLVMWLIILTIIGGIGFWYYKSKTKVVAIVPIIHDLYYEVDDSLEEISKNASDKKTYVKSGAKGNACSIIISYGTTTSQDHVYEYFTNVKKNLEPKRDDNNNVINELEIYTPDEGNLTINNTTWYFMNVFYKIDKDSPATTLKYRYMTSMNKGYYYDIELINNGNDISCNASLDNFAESLKFID